jgi:hypothetical protein
VVEIAAQRMCGWKRAGEPFRRLLNQNRDIPPKASRAHGYTREILERDGDWSVIVTKISRLPDAPAVRALDFFVCTARGVMFHSAPLWKTSSSSEPAARG